MPMKVSEIKAQDVMDLARIDADATDKGLIEKMFLPAAIEHIKGYTGLSDEKMDTYADLPIAVCALCAFMYDNRSIEVASEKENKVVREIVEKYSSNLIPGSDTA